MKNILLIGTGGTIVSKETHEGLIPVMNTSELLNSIPELKNICHIDTIQLYNIDSTNITPNHWIEIAHTIQENYDKYDGFVITHGTDTMAYTSSALSYLIQNSRKPIVLTGSQKPIFNEGSDARRNLLDAFIYATDDQSYGVSIVFFGKAITGTRARKNYTKSFMAFGSINHPYLAEISNGIIRRIENVKYTGETTFYSKLNTNVGLIKLVPGLKEDIMEHVINSYDAVVVESFGTGGIPEYSNFAGKIAEGIRKGKLFVMSTQVPNEGSDLGIYNVGFRIVNSLNVLEAHDMTSESCLAKLMWILAYEKDFKKQKEMFYNPIGFDISWRYEE